MSQAALRLQRIERSFREGAGRLHVLRGADLEIRPGELVALVGPSGAGKSTLLQVSGLLETPDAGEVYIGGMPCGRLDDDARTRVRRSSIGFVYQLHHLLPELSALENVMLPQLIAGLDRAEAERRATELLAYLGLAERLSHRPAELSGGEQQRVAIARAVANAPRVLLADEPTGNLDSATGGEIVELLASFARECGQTVVIVTHDVQLATRAGRVIRMRDGRIDG